MAHDAVDYGIDLGESAPYFVGKLCDDSEFLFGFAAYLPDSEDTVLGHLISVPVRRLRDRDAAEYRRIGLTAAAHTSVYIAHGTANAICYGRTLDSPILEDIDILAELAKHPHSSVRQVALNGIGVLGKTTCHAIAVRLLCETEIGAEPKLADAMCKALGHGNINLDSLSEEEVRAVLGKIVPVPSLDEYYIGRFLEWASRRYPEAVFEFVQQRLEYSRRLNEKNGGGSSYRPVPFQDMVTRFQGLRQSEKYAQYLQEICNLLRDVFDSERSWLLELFWAIGAKDVTTLSVLDDLLHPGDPTSLETLQELISQAPPEFALSCPFFAAHVVEICAERSQELLDDMLSTLVTNAHLGMSSRTVGQLPPKFLSVRDRASQLAGRFPSGSAAHLLFVRIRESAENAIRDQQNQDAEFGFQ